jgi:glycosyltransferase involved in cell wall biosynthesis
MRAEREQGHETDLVLVQENSFHTDVDALVQPGTVIWLRWLARIQFARSAIGQYDVFHFNKGETFLPGSLPFAFDLLWLRRKGKHTIVTFQGSDARPQVPGAPKTRWLPATVTNWIKRIRIAQISRWSDTTYCLNPDLLQYVPGARFMPYASVDLDALQPAPKESRNGRAFRVVHAPTNRQLKGTQAVIDAVNEAARSTDIELDLVEGVPHAEVIERIRRADIAVDQLELGWYGGFAVECMALGTPVIAWIDPAQLDAAPSEFTNELPIIRATKASLTAVLLHAAAELDLVSTAAKARLFAEQRHQPSSVAIGH